MPGELWPWMKSRSPPCVAVGACQKWPKPMSYSVAADWKLAMWPPSSELSLFARRMIAIAFQRMIERSRCSIARSPGDFSSASGAMVFL